MILRHLELYEWTCTMRDSRMIDLHCVGYYATPIFSEVMILTSLEDTHSALPCHNIEDTTIHYLLFWMMITACNLFITVQPR